MSVERVERKGGSVVWRVRWRQGEHNRSKVEGRKRDADAFEAELRRRKRTGQLAQLDVGKEPLAKSAKSGGASTPSPTSPRGPCGRTPPIGTRTSSRGSDRSRCES